MQLPPGQTSLTIIGFTFAWPSTGIIKEKYNAANDTWVATNSGTVTVTPAPDAAGNIPASFPKDGSATQKAQVTASFSAPGRYRIQMGVEASWWSGSGDSWNGSSNVLTMEMNVINFDKLQYRLNGVGAFTNAPVAPQILYLPINQNVEFQAVQQPEDSPWPSGQPVWSSEGAGLSGASGSGKSKTIRINASGNYSITATCGEYSKHVDIVVPAITIESDRSAVCAGGWSAAHGYQYLPKDPDGTTHPYAERIKPDPHIATVTATAKDGDGNPISGLSIEFKWDMPGDAPAKTETKTTLANGTASVDVISGDELSKDADEDTGASLFDTPTSVTATCLGIKVEKKLDVVAPVVQWQYKNEAGGYVEWDGETSERNSDPEHPDEVLLRCLLMHDNLPVTGHSISWGFEKVLDKAGAEVLASDPDYLTYGHMSGGISTTTSDGSATATYTLGYNFGQIIFRIDDENINTLDLTPPLVARTTESVIKVVAHAQFRQIADDDDPSKPKKKKRIKKPALVHDYYKWVDGPAGFSTNRGYPAPAGEEGQELLPETRNFVTYVLNKKDSEYRPDRNAYVEWKAGIRDPRKHRVPMQFGQWWYAQVIGDDATSATYHFADMKQIKNNKLYLYGAAFDIVLTNVPIFQNSGKREEFETYVFDLRHAGIVAWHRWADEPGSEENEMHCIDAAVPFIKPPLSNGFWTNNSGTRRKGQVLAFLDGETGGGSYLVDWAITEHQKSAVRNRATTQRDDMKAKPGYANASAVDWPNRQ